MLRLRHFYGQGHYYYLTENIYRRARIFDPDRFKRKFSRTVADLRTELGFKIFACVLMPEHCHLLIWPSPRAGADGRFLASAISRGTLLWYGIVACIVSGTVPF